MCSSSHTEDCVSVFTKHFSSEHFRSHQLQLVIDTPWAHLFPLLKAGQILLFPGCKQSAAALRTVRGRPGLQLEQLGRHPASWVSAPGHNRTEQETLAEQTSDVAGWM